MFDVVIIGAGPAGLSAAVNACARNKDVIVFGRHMETSWIYKAEKVNNYIGMHNVSGEQMMKTFYEHVNEMNITVKNGRVLQVLSMGDYYSVNFENEFYDTKTIIIATGIERGQKIKGEEEFLGKGVSYCATCDGMLYKNKTAFVIGETEEGEEDSAFLSEICSKVYYFPKYEIKNKINEKVEIVKNKPIQVIGKEFVTGIELENETINCDGVFFIKKSVPMENLIYGIEMNNNSININRVCETNLKGVYAAGDCTGWPYQVSKAVGEGLTAALQASKYIDENK